MVWIEAQACARMTRDLGTAEACVNAHVRVPLTQGEFDALVDFAYNVGVHAFSGSKLLQKLNAGDFAGADTQFRVWDKAGGRVIAGLEARRIGEAEMFQGSMA